MKRNQEIGVSKLLLLSVLFFSSAVQAECTYNKNLKGEEFPIGIRLSWSTSSERNTAVFILEKVGENNEFQAVTTLDGAGNSDAVVEYRYLDVRPISAQVSYRIKQVDLDGTFSYSDVFTIHRKLETNIILASLSNDLINKSCDFTLDAVKEGIVNLKLVDNTGKIVWQGSKKLINGLNDISIDFSAQPEGEYKIVAVMGKDEKMVAVQKSFDEIERASNVAGRKKASKN